MSDSRRPQDEGSALQRREVQSGEAHSREAQSEEVQSPSSGSAQEAPSGADGDGSDTIPPLLAVVGIGGSAGALDGYERFFLSLSSGGQMAYVVVAHQDPSHRGMMPELLQRCTALPVVVVSPGRRLEPDNVYVAPPGQDVTVSGGRLYLHPTQLGQALPIDRFFESLSLDQGRNAVAVVLSGMGQDGSQGVQAVRRRGGLVLVQEPGSAEYPSMPASAIATQAAQHVLPAEELATHLHGLITHRPALRPEDLYPDELTPDGDGLPSPFLQSILLLVRAQTGHDFTGYKHSTIVRRVNRRIQSHGLSGIGQYARYLRETPGEVAALYKELTINVTSFFRDSDAFASLREQLRQYLSAQYLSAQYLDSPSPGRQPSDTQPSDTQPSDTQPSDTQPSEAQASAGPPGGSQPEEWPAAHRRPGAAEQDAFRVWTPGCSTGEEAYSLAITLQELLSELGLVHRVKVQIFATDIDEVSVSVARAGVYSSRIAYVVSPERLERFFTAREEGYQIRPHIRDMVVFAIHNTFGDPPFTRLDLLCCRNMLIYLGSELQRRLIPLFHYTLKPGGLMFLGPSETVGNSRELFLTLDGQWKIFRRASGPAQPLNLSYGFPPVRPGQATPIAHPPASRVPREAEVSQMVNSVLLSEFTPPSVVVTPRGDIVHVVGRTAPYLELALGRVGTNVLEMARDGLRYELSGMLREAVAEHHEVSVRGLRVTVEGEHRAVNLRVRPLNLPRLTEPLLLIVFELEVRPSPEPARSAGPEGQAGGGAARPETGEQTLLVRELQRELRSSREYLQANIEEMEVSVEQLRSSNEELQTTNEELQSTNEELMTSKEELQSLNEELITVNTEHQIIITDLAQANDDMKNLLTSAGIATVFLDNQLRIKRFTPKITEVINLISSDVGRPIGHIVPKLRYQHLERDSLEVLRTLTALETEVQTTEGEWYLMRVTPYRTFDNFIDGVVVVFTNLTTIKRLERQLQVSTLYADEAINAFPDPFIVLDTELKVVSANRAFYTLLRLTPGEAGGRALDDLGASGRSFRPLLGALERVARNEARLTDHAAGFDVPFQGHRIMKFTARHLLSRDTDTELVLLTLEDVTDLLNEAERLGVQGLVEENEAQEDGLQGVGAQEPQASGPPAAEVDGGGDPE
ncbi:chemotaxis protein CheB [Deinococcus sp.]|uniref:chemotaxis protein CheB n=1 Tax=Deinococcus sp. TaxID=47478 RepID=UPI003C7EB9CE